MNALTEITRQIAKLNQIIADDTTLVQQTSQRLLQNKQRLKHLEEQANTLKYQGFDFTNIPWADLLNVDDAGNTNKELKVHMHNLMEGLPGINLSSYNIDTLQTAPKLYIPADVVSPHYKQLLVRALDILADNLKDQKAQGRFQQPDQMGKMIAITDPSLSEFGSYQCFKVNNSWFILRNRKFESTTTEYKTTAILVECLCQHMAHHNN